MTPTFVSLKNPARAPNFKPYLQADAATGTPEAFAHGNDCTWRVMDRQENKLTLVQTCGDRALIFCPGTGFAWTYADDLKKWKTRA